MASKGKTKKFAEDFFNTGNLPDPQEAAADASGEDTEEVLGQLADEQEQQDAQSEEQQKAEAEAEAQGDAQQDEAQEDAAGQKPQKGKPAKAKEADKAAEADAEGQQDADADGNKADEDPNALPEEVEKLPRVQALLKAEEVVSILRDALTEGYALDLGDLNDQNKVAFALDRLRIERQDAHMLYSIIDQALPASALLSSLENNFDRKVVEPIYLGIADHLGKNGFLDAYLKVRGFQLAPLGAEGKPNGAAAATLQGAASGQGKVDPGLQPLMAEIESLKRQLAPQGAGAADSQKNEAAFEGEIKRLMKDKGVPEDFFGDYKTAIVGMVVKYPGGKKAVMDRIAKGNFVDVKRFFATYNNAVIERTQKYSKSVAAPTKKVTIGAKPPAKQENSGARPQAGAKKATDPRQDRISKMLTAWDKK